MEKEDRPNRLATKRLATGARAACAAACATALLAACASLPGLENRTPSIRPVEDGIEFRYRSPSARTVQLLGDWPGNDFGLGEGTAGDVLVGLMDDADGDGTWERVVFLPPGRYRYRYLVDEVYLTVDPENPERVPDGRGGYYSLLVVY